MNSIPATVRALLLRDYDGRPDSITVPEVLVHRPGPGQVVYDDMVQDTGFLRFAPVRPARGGMFSVRERAGRAGVPSITAPISEEQFYN